MTPTTPITLPDFAPRAAGETLADYGRRAMIYALQLQTACFARLDDEALDAAADSLTHAQTAKGITDGTLACLAGLQRDIRARLTGRQAERAAGVQRLQAWLDAQPSDAQPSDAGPAAGSDAGPHGGGGAKVPRGPRPTGPTAPAAFQVPALQLQADAF